MANAVTENLINEIAARFIANARELDA